MQDRRAYTELFCSRRNTQFLSQNNCGELCLYWYEFRHSIDPKPFDVDFKKPDRSKRDPRLKGENICCCLTSVPSVKERLARRRPMRPETRRCPMISLHILQGSQPYSSDGSARSGKVVDREAAP